MLIAVSSTSTAVSICMYLHSHWLSPNLNSPNGLIHFCRFRLTTLAENELLPIALFAANRCQCERPYSMYVLQKILGFGVCLQTVLSVFPFDIFVPNPFFRISVCVCVCIWVCVHTDAFSSSDRKSPLTQWHPEIPLTWDEWTVLAGCPTVVFTRLPQSTSFLLCTVSTTILFVCVDHCLWFLAGVQEIYNKPANWVLLSSSFWDFISCFSYLWRRYRQVHVITIVVGCFPANLREDRAFRQCEVWVHLKSFYRTCQNWTLPP